MEENGKVKMDGCINEKNFQRYVTTMRGKSVKFGSDVKKKSKLKKSFEKKKTFSKYFPNL